MLAWAVAIADESITISLTEGAHGVEVTAFVLGPEDIGFMLSQVRSDDLLETFSAMPGIKAAKNAKGPLQVEMHGVARGEAPAQEGPDNSGEVIDMRGSEGLEDLAGKTDVARSPSGPDEPESPQGARPEAPEWMVF